MNAEKTLATPRPSSARRKALRPAGGDCSGCWPCRSAIFTLAALFIDMAVTGIPRLTPEFFTNFPSRRPAEAGILSSWVGSVLVMMVTALVRRANRHRQRGLPGRVRAQELGHRSVIEINITNLAGVPSIIYGLLALGLFVYTFKLGQSILTAGLTLALC
jgi:phosphate transport system permease protein